MGKVTESIYSSKTVTVPLADVVFISHRSSCSIVVMKGTTYDATADEYNNPVVIEASEVADFSAAWCRYRYELESETIQDLSPQPLQATTQKSGDAHEIWAAAQLAPGEGIEAGVARVEALLNAPRVPMTRDQVDDLAEDSIFLQTIYGIVRSIEAHHSIGVKP